jgi:regulatory protein
MEEMLEITDLTKQKKSDERFNVFLDGRFYCALTAEMIVKEQLKIGSEVSKEHIDKLQFLSERQTALNKAVNYLGSRLKTQKQMREYLKSKGYVEGVVKYVLEKLIEYDFLNDENFSESFVRVKSKTLGKRRIEMELKQKGVDEKLAKEKTEDITGEYEVAGTLAEKYLKNKPRDQKTAQKLYAFLAYRGFISGDINRIIKEQIKDIKEEVEKDESWD